MHKCKWAAHSGFHIFEGFQKFVLVETTERVNLEVLDAEGTDFWVRRSEGQILDVDGQKSGVLRILYEVPLVRSRHSQVTALEL